MPKFLVWVAIGLWVYPIASKYVSAYLDNKAG